MSQINVCSSGWHGVHGSTVTLKNPNTHNPVTVSADPTLSWPFTNKTSPFTINAPGTCDVVLADIPTNNPTPQYGYDTKNCPGDHIEVNPKTVIIG